ncbi:aspartate ammonia-lyase [uncultured Bifidobacterium sp.]|uniref:aspartate ammonia-lyase n=1 Tax=uncultured Bifidobacterium sp. TaxID=165187 RepID=UPI0028DCB320|nr:aspartate ammonia-lyase [uncultured Bifidobacterium sp.]
MGSTDTGTAGTRTEHDCVGVLEVPRDVYWGIHTLRALRNFTVGRARVGDHPELVRGYALVKRACALANEELGLLDPDRARLIAAACRDVESGALDDQFPVDALQGGAGTSTNMNVNEVVANRALELAGHARGDYRFIHPNDDVNRSQSTNDTYPTACRLAILDALGPLLQSTRSLARAFHRLADRHADDVTIGRTQLQDAVPMTFGQEFHVFASLLKADAKALEALRPTLETINLGATAVGTGICADVRFRAEAVRNLASITGLALCAAPDPVAAVTDMSAFVGTSSTLKNLAIHLKKAADDLRLLNSGPHAGLDEIDVPARQAGSSIMPGKVNPVIPECVDQCCFMVIGMDATVCLASSEGQLQLNAFEPVVIHQILSSIALLRNAMDMFRGRCVDGITVDTERGRRYAEASPSIAAALNPVIGYERSVAIAKEATRSGRTVREVAANLTDLPGDRLDALLDPLTLSRRLGQTCRERAAATPPTA